MSFIVKSNLTQMVFKEETTRGTYNAPQASDVNVRLHYDGSLSNETTKEMIGKLGNGKMLDGRHYTRERAMGLPEITVEYVKATTPQDEPKWFKFANACGYTIYTTPTTLEKGLYFSGQPSCAGLSCLVEGLTCGTLPDGIYHSLRGIAGNMELKAESAQSPIVAVFSGMKGAYLGMTDRTAAAVNPLTGNDTAIAEMFGDYTTTIGAYSPDCYAFSFNLNNEINFVPGTNDEGISYFDIANQSARLTVTVPVAQVASKDYMNEYLTNQILTSITINGGASSAYDMTFNSCEYTNIQLTEVNNVSCFELEFNILEDALIVQK